MYLFDFYFTFFLYPANLSTTLIPSKCMMVMVDEEKAGEAASTPMEKV